LELSHQTPPRRIARACDPKVISLILWEKPSLNQQFQQLNKRLFLTGSIAALATCCIKMLTTTVAVADWACV